MNPHTTSDFYTREIDIPINGNLHAIAFSFPWDQTAVGIGSLWDPTPAERAAIADGQPVLIWFPTLNEHPPVFIQALEDPLDDATLGIPPESGLKRVQLVGGEWDGYWVPATKDRVLVLKAGGNQHEQSGHEAYGHIPGDPAHEFRHLAEYLAATIPGADYTEKTTNLATERAECDAWRVANLTALADGVLPPQVTDLDTPIDRVQANLVLIKFPEVTQPSSLVPGP